MKNVAAREEECVPALPLPVPFSLCYLPVLPYTIFLERLTTLAARQAAQTTTHRRRPLARVSRHSAKQRAPLLKTILLDWKTGQEAGPGTSSRALSLSRSAKRNGRNY